MRTRFPVESTSPATKLTDHSGVATAGEVTKVMDGDDNTVLYRLQNLSEVHPLWFNDTGGDAGEKALGSFVLQPLGYYEGQTTQAVSVFCKAAEPFSAARWTYVVE